MEKFDDIEVASTNYTISKGRLTKCAVRVYRNKEKIAEVFPTKVNPLKYIRIYKTSKYRLELIDQLRKAEVSDSTIEKLLVNR